MWRIFILMLGGLFGPLSGAAVGCDIPAPPVPADTKPETPKSDDLKKTVTIELKGKVVAYRCLMFSKTNLAIAAGGKVYWLLLGDNKEFQKRINELGEKSAVVTGELEEVTDADAKVLVVNVRDVRAVTGTDSYVKKSVKIELRGELEEVKEDILLPDGVSLKIRVEKQTYYLDLRGNKTLWGKARNSMYQRVIVTGKLADNNGPTVVRVDTLEAAPPEIVACYVP